MFIQYICTYSTYMVAKSEFVIHPYCMYPYRYIIWLTAPMPSRHLQHKYRKWWKRGLSGLSRRLLL